MEKPLIIGITGGSGSGKTSFINALRAAFSEEELCVISQDDYYRPIEEQELDEEGVENFDKPGSIHKKDFARDIKKLIAGRGSYPTRVYLQQCGFPTQTPGVSPRAHDYRRGFICVSLQKSAQTAGPESISSWPRKTFKVIRRIKRDRVERNYPLDDVLYRYQYHVLPTFEKYIRPYMEEADLVINNNQDFKSGLMVMKGFMENYLNQRKLQQP